MGSLSKLKKSAGSAKPVLSNTGTGPTAEVTRGIGGLPVLVTPAVPDGEAWVLDGTRVAAVVRLDGEVEADRSARFTMDATTIRVVSRLNSGVPYAGTVARIAAT